MWSLARQDSRPAGGDHSDAARVPRTSRDRPPYPWHRVRFGCGGTVRPLAGPVDESRYLQKAQGVDLIGLFRRIFLMQNRTMKPPPHTEKSANILTRLGDWV